LKYHKTLKKNIDSALTRVFWEINIFLVLLYLRAVQRTSAIVVEHRYNSNIKINCGCIFLYWHENLYNLVFLQRSFSNNMSVVVASTDKILFWTTLLRRAKTGIIFSKHPIWLKAVKKNKNNVFLAYDGPYGPSKTGNCKINNSISRLKLNSCFVHFQYSRQITLNSNWETIILPALFSTIRIEIADHKPY
jgi:lysophospholipid acyltransferase (LPLAT)-like uncharacterized protein